MQAKVKYVLMMSKIYKIERLKQYNMTKLSANYVCELISRQKKNITGLDNSGCLKYNQFPTWDYGIATFKEIVDTNLALDPSININNIFTLPNFGAPIISSL